MNESLEFTKLPLIEVTCTVTRNESSDLGFTELRAMADRLAADLPQVIQFSGGIPAETLFFATSDPSGVQFVNTEKGLSLEVRRGLFRLSWISQNGFPYIRYAAMKKIMELATTLEPPHHLGLAQLTYVSEFPDPSLPFSKLIDHQYLSPIAVSFDPFLVDQSWRIETEVDFRLVLQRGGRGRILVTTGVLRADGDALAALDKVHASMTKEFERILSPEAKEKYGFSTAP